MPDDQKPPVTDVAGKDDVVVDKSKPKINEVEDDLSPEEVTSARSLFKALKDPDTAQEIIETLAKRSGILDKKGEPKGTEKQTEKALGKITKALQSKLGKDFDKFSGTVGPALDEAIEELLEEKFGRSEDNTVSEKWSESVDSFMETHQFTSKKVQTKMEQLVDRNPPNVKSKGFKAKEYLEDMWELAHARLNIELPTTEKEKEKPLLDNTVERERPAKVSLSDAIDFAMKGIRLKPKQN
jgi:uncharacterized protein YjgD (DUF1641 family)